MNSADWSNRRSLSPKGNPLQTIKRMQKQSPKEEIGTSVSSRVSTADFQLHRVQSAKEPRRVRSPDKRQEPTSIEQIPTPGSFMRDLPFSEKEPNFLKGSHIRMLDDQNMDTSKCESLAQLHIMLSESEDLCMNRNIDRVNRLAKEVLDQIGEPCRAVTELLDLARQICVDNLRLVQEVLNTEENNEVLEKRVAEFSIVVHELRSKSEQTKRQSELLMRTISEQQKEKRALLQIISQLQAQVGRRQSQRSPTSLPSSPKTPVSKDLLCELKNFDRVQGFLSEESSIQQTEQNGLVRKNFQREHCGERQANNTSKVQQPWLLKTEPSARESTMEKTQKMYKPLTTLKSKLRNHQ